MSKKNILQMIARTNVGRVRDHNEDNFISTGNVANIEWVIPSGAYTNPEQGSLMAIADGMGGLNAGEVASAITIENIKEYLSKAVKSINQAKTSTLLLKAIQNAHKAIVEHSVKFPDTQGMGTTVILSWILNGVLHTAWSGDSRCYIFRPALGLKQISKDHSYVQQLVEEGKITEDQAFLHPQGNIILQSLGDPERNPQPDVVSVPVAKGDIILICSDGLSGMLTDAQMAAIINEYGKDISTCADMLIEKANEAGGTDNITLIMAKIVEGNEPKGNNNEIFFNQKEVSKAKSKKKNFIFFSALILAVVIVAFTWIGFSGKQKNVITTATDTTRQNINDTVSKTHQAVKQKDSNTQKEPVRLGKKREAIDSNDKEGIEKLIKEAKKNEIPGTNSEKSNENDLDLKPNQNTAKKDTSGQQNNPHSDNDD